MLRASLQGQLKQTHLPRWRPLQPIFEAIMNAYQAAQDRGEAAEIRIEIYRENTLALGDTPRISGFKITDNGSGFTDLNMDSFNTTFSQYKELRGGKGLGRFLFLKAFDNVAIASVFKDETEGNFGRNFDFNPSYNPDAISLPARTVSPVGSSITLSGYLEPFRSEAPVEAGKIARQICEHFILLLMGANRPIITLIDGSSEIDVNEVFEAEFRSSAVEHKFNLGSHEFSVLGFRVRETHSARHRIIYCAHDRAVVSEPLAKWLPNFSTRLIGEDGDSFVFLAVVTGQLLDDRVNHARTEFDISGGSDEMDEQQSSLFKDDVRRADIRNHVLEFVHEALSDILGGMNRQKLVSIEDYVSEEAPHYRILMKKSDDFIDKIPPNPSKGDIEQTLHRELHHREVELKKKGSRILLEADKLSDYDDYKDRLSEFMSDYNEIGVSALAQYVTHRKIILTLFEKALSIDDTSGKYPLERVLHNIIFPIGTTSDDVLLSQQNLWIIDEKLNYHSMITSDKRLDKVDGLNSNSALRPDVLVFDRKYPLGDGHVPLSSLTVVEFKRPMRKDYDHVDNPLSQVIDVVNTIRDRKMPDQNGRPIPVASDGIPTNCYIVCDITDRLRKVLLAFDATPTPDGQGFYGYHRNSKLYYEVLDYTKVLNDAKQRNRALFDRLKLL